MSKDVALIFVLTKVIAAIKIRPKKRSPELFVSETFNFLKTYTGNEILFQAPAACEIILDFSPDIVP
jgi:hypothetical protein